MGAISLETARGAEQYADLFNTTRDEIMSGDMAIDQIFASNGVIGDKAISPILYKMWQNKKNVKGGLGMTGVGLVDTLKGGPINPYGEFSLLEAPQMTKTHKLETLCYVSIPIVTHPADLIQNRGVAQVVDLQKTKMRAAAITASQILVRCLLGNKTQYADPSKGATEAQYATNWDFTTDFLPFAGFGFGNSKVTDTVFGDSNIYGGINRALPENAKYRPVIKTSSSLSLATDGVAPFSSWNDFSIDHLDWLIDQCRVGPIHGNIVTVPSLLWQRLRQIAYSKQVFGEDVDMLKLGMSNLTFREATIVPDYDFKPGDSVDCFNTNYTYIAFADGELPTISNAVPLPGKGYKTIVATMDFACQLWAQYPKMHSRIVLG